MHPIAQTFLTVLALLGQGELPQRTNAERLAALEETCRIYHQRVDRLELQLQATSAAAQLDAAYRVVQSGGVAIRQQPIVFGQPGLYKLTQDMIFAGDAFIVGDGVTVDLNGHTVVYGATQEHAVMLRFAGRGQVLRSGGQMIGGYTLE